MDRRHPFEPIPDCIEEKDTRTQRAYREEMQVSLAQAGGRYTVYSASGNTYEVDIASKTCTCTDFRENEPAGGCKHLRRVDLEIRTNQVPTPDGSLPTRPAADGGSVVTETEPRETSEGRIRGPISEFDANGNATGATYYRCRDCGTEAMRRRDLEACCDEQSR
jgi:hypothetical protein